MHPQIKLRLNKVQTPSEAQAVWHDYWGQLDGCTFVLSQSGPGASRFAARLDLPGGAFLRSVFAYEHLYFINHAIIASTLENGQLHLPVDYTISFDSNTASYLRALANGSSSPMVPALHACMKALGARKLNWDYVPFMMERAESILTNRDLEFIYDTVLAAERFAACDMTHFEATSQIVVESGDVEMARRAQQELASWHSVLIRGSDKFIADRIDFFYAAVLKLTLLQRSLPSARSIVTKMAQLLSFLEHEFRCMPLLIVVTAFEFFRKGGEFRPFSKIAGGRSNLKEKAKNIAWDLYHVHQRQECVNFSGRNGAFHLPFFLTFDKGLACLFDVWPQRSCLIYDGQGVPQFFADFDFQARVSSLVPELVPILQKHFNIEAHERRMADARIAPPDLSPVIAGLESKL